MSLRRQLLLVALCLLCLPWAGCQFIREMEGALRDSQARAVQASAAAIAISLADRGELLASARLRGADARDGSGQSLYAPLARRTLLLDGYADDWEGTQSKRLAPRAGADARHAVDYRLLADATRAYLLLEVADPEVCYRSPSYTGRNGEQLILRAGNTPAQQFLINTEAPGRVRARALDAQTDPGAALRIRGAWQDSRQGYRVELELPLTLLGGRLGLAVIDARCDGGTPRGSIAAANYEGAGGARAPVLLRESAALNATLQPFLSTVPVIEVYDNAGFRLGQAAAGDTAAAGGSETFWLLRSLYRLLLGAPDQAAISETAGTAGTEQEAAAAGLPSALLADALGGTAGYRWRAQPGPNNRARIEAAAPIPADGPALGAVRVAQGSEAYLALADRAMGRILLLSLAVTAVVVIGLLGYASVLSLRIRRLQRSTAAVVDHRGAIAGSFRPSRARDEIGELSRHFGELLDEIGSYNAYLGQLARRLSHELRTPIAVIQSSLDNLEHGETSQRGTYLQRAREGLRRLSYILGAMSEASRLEDSLRASQRETVDLRTLLEGIGCAYADSYEQPIQLQLTPEAAPSHTAPELLVQALDKLVDNACSFALPDTAVTLSLGAHPQAWRISVHNHGPRLPDTLRARLFEPMVSLRSGHGEAPHLGLGLHIVALIMEHLEGEVRAENDADGGGVCFSLLLPRADLTA